MRPMSSRLTVLFTLLAASVSPLGTSTAGAAPAVTGPGMRPGGLAASQRPSLRRGASQAYLPRRGGRSFGGQYAGYPYGYGGYGYGAGPYGSGFGYGPYPGYGSSLPFTGATVTSRVGEPLAPWLGDFGGSPDRVVVAPPYGPPAVPGIAPSPVKPPAIYIVQGDRADRRARGGRVRGGGPVGSDEAVAGLAPSSGPKIITVGPGGS